VRYYDAAADLFCLLEGAYLPFAVATTSPLSSCHLTTSRYATALTLALYHITVKTRAMLFDTFHHHILSLMMMPMLPCRCFDADARRLR